MKIRFSKSLDYEQDWWINFIILTIYDCVCGLLEVFGSLQIFWLKTINFEELFEGWSNCWLQTVRVVNSKILYDWIGKFQSKSWNLVKIWSLTQVSVLKFVIFVKKIEIFSPTCNILNGISDYDIFRLEILFTLVILKILLYLRSCDIISTKWKLRHMLKFEIRLSVSKFLSI